MAEKKAGRCEVIMAGTGGRGVLTAGRLLVDAGYVVHKHVAYLPSYFGDMRGSPCECTVILSGEPISSPILAKTRALVVFDDSQLAGFLDRVTPGGVVVLETTARKNQVKREDVQVLEIPAMKLAAEMGDVRSANLILLGGYIQITGVVPLELAEAEVGKRFKGGGGSALLLNLNALRTGAKIAERESAQWQSK